MTDSLLPPPRLPDPIRTDSNTFAHNTLKVRVPAILREISRRNPDYQASIHDALVSLAQAMADDQPIPPPDFSGAPDEAEWQRAYQAHAGETWLAAEWWFAEVYAYRLVIAITRWRETGRDPFLPWKQEELASHALWLTLNHVLTQETESTSDRLHHRFTQALWGNRIDLSMDAVRAQGTKWHVDDLLADDRAALVEQVMTHPGDMHFINDNTGSELALDLALADALLDGTARTVTLHLKEHPTFVSDATRSDVQQFIAHLLDDRQPEIKAFGDRLAAAQMEGRLILRPDAWWNSARFLWEMPESFLRDQFEGATLVIVKGDANYRRIVGDALWPPETPFAQVLSYFPAPICALRTLKSDPIVGLRPGLAERLDAAGSAWRTTGKYGVIQFRR
ncbi:protein-glutamate O-methyltransferase family protein [Anaerolineae bacterium CFX9]|nr:protein-glutamate O-methyltransferase family protein [Anaerolineae bacterium CFX9]